MKAEKRIPDDFMWFQNQNNNSFQFPMKTKIQVIQHYLASFFYSFLGVFGWFYLFFKIKEYSTFHAARLQETRTLGDI